MSAFRGFHTALLALVVCFGCVSSAQAAIIYEMFTDRASFEARLDGSTDSVNFDDITTSGNQIVSFASDRYEAEKGIVIAAAHGGGQYVSRTWNHPADYVPTSSPNAYSPGPSGGSENETIVWFTSGESSSTVAAFGCYFIDVDHPADVNSHLILRDSLGYTLVESPQASGNSGQAVFSGVVAWDTVADGPVSVFGSVEIIAGMVWPDQAYAEGVVLDDFVFALPASSRMPEPATLSLLTLGGLALIRRRR